MMRPDDVRPDLIGDGYDPEPLMTAREVAEMLRLPAKAVYGLPIRRVQLGQRRTRWRPSDVREFIERRLAQA